MAPPESGLQAKTDKRVFVNRFPHGDIMKKLVFSLFSVVASTGVFIAKAVAAFPPNDWHPAEKSCTAH
jgi:hypothetical protein